MYFFPPRVQYNVHTHYMFECVNSQSTVLYRVSLLVVPLFPATVGAPGVSASSCHAVVASCHAL